ncbi:hypothetical protein [Leptothoe spongobia]|uniref:Uncharacterized protein n=1 Tax=Leptothoe spongobia TAU-MAC 1115 TaxID=1967444 RepID=A0A947DF83_9CYAN|nr:hypothetical protein [Leptothoe spongobia]MBT9315675.1 hypothetical protein [Leptothoe spongobia TAU-MAC 1115]
MGFLPAFFVFSIVFLSFSRTVLTPPETPQEIIDPAQKLSAALLEYQILQELKKEAEQQQTRPKSSIVQ